MAKLNRQFRLEEVAEFMARDKDMGETMGVGAEKRRLKVQEDTAEKKRVEETEKREETAAKVQKNDQMVDKLAQLSGSEGQDVPLLESDANCTTALKEHSGHM